MIAKQFAESTYSQQQIQEGLQALKAVRKIVDDKDTPKDITMSELLLKANVSLDLYMSSLKRSVCGNNVILKRNPSESWINNYNPDILKLWRANMDVQYILDPYACVMYIAAYLVKNERSMSEMLKQVLK